MHDIKFIRENPKRFIEAMKKRGVYSQVQDLFKGTDPIFEGDEHLRELMTQQQTLQKQRNEKSREIGEIKKSQGDATALMEEVKEINDSIASLEGEIVFHEGEIENILIALPNILDEDVPDGADEESNVELRAHGEARLPSNNPKDHVAIGEGLGMMDFETAAKLSGARFVLLRDGLAKMERALAAFMLDMHTNEFGYTEIMPPSLVRSDIMQGTGQLPKFAEDIFRIGKNGSEAIDKNDLWLIPTAEVPLTNIVANEIVDTDKLPMRFTAYTPCFRAEAGAAGRDTRGMIRQHQFSKVELVSIAHPDESRDEHERMTNCAEQILQKLDLPYRVMFLCSGDTGFSSRRTYDIEVWLPGQNEGRGAFREISSCSNCGDFQARRMKARFRDKGAKETRFLHTLNGSGLAIGRTMIAVLENHQREDGSVAIPAALQPYMGGMDVLAPSDS